MGDILKTRPFHKSANILLKCWCNVIHNNFLQNLQKLIKKQKNSLLKITCVFQILWSDRLWDMQTHQIRNCKILYSFQGLPIVLKNSLTPGADFLDLLLMIEKIDLSLRYVLSKEMCHISKELVFYIWE